MRGRRMGLIIMVASLSFGTLYAFSFLRWLSAISATFRQEAWSWWVIALPVLAMVALTVLLTAWLGWVMASASGARRGELPASNSSQRESEGTGAVGQGPL